MVSHCVSSSMPITTFPMGFSHQDAKMMGILRPRVLERSNSRRVVQIKSSSNGLERTESSSSHNLVLNHTTWWVASQTQQQPILKRAQTMNNAIANQIDLLCMCKDCDHRGDHVFIDELCIHQPATMSPFQLVLNQQRACWAHLPKPC